MENNTIIFLYDKKLGEFPRTNINFKRPGISRFYRYIIESRKTPYKIFTVDEYIKYNDYSVPVIYVIELIWKDIDSLFKYVDIETINYVIKRRIPLLIYFPTEGFSFKTAGWIDTLRAKFKEFNLEKNLKYFISGNLNVDDIDIFKKTYPANIFEHVLYKTSNDIGSIEPLSLCTTPKNYDFLSYNSNPRPGRVALATEVLRNNINANSLFSWIGNPNWQIDDTIPLKHLPKKGQSYFIKMIKRGFTPIILDVDENEKGGIVNFINKDHYSQSYFSLITETETETDCLFITEKTYKAILASHPFIILGNPGILKSLRSMGYKTFPSLFDESYDDETNTKTRIQMILKEVQKFKELNTREKESLIAEQNHIVEHNYKNLLKRWDTCYLKDIDNILSDIANDIKKG